MLDEREIEIVLHLADVPSLASPSQAAFFKEWSDTQGPLPLFVFSFPGSLTSLKHSQDTSLDNVSSNLQIAKFFSPYLTGLFASLKMFAYFILLETHCSLLQLCELLLDPVPTPKVLFFRILLVASCPPLYCVISIFTMASAPIPTLCC